MAENDRPSDREAAYQPNEGSAIRGADADSKPRDQLGTSGFRPGELTREDVLARANQVNRDVTTGNSGLPSGADPYAPSGTDVHTAGARAADALPKDAVMTPASELTPREGGTKQD